MAPEIATLRNALNLFLQSLPLGCFFNIVKFGTKFEYLFEHSQSYNEESLATAKTFVEHIKADMGGTCFLGPLSWAINDRVAGYLQNVILLTDGSPSDYDAKLKDVQAQAKGRTFMMGIGDYNAHIVSEMAHSGNTEPIRVRDLNTSVVQVIERSTVPLCKRFEFEWPEQLCVRTIATPKHVHTNSPFVVFGRTRITDPSNDLTCTLKCCESVFQSRVIVREGTALSVWCA